MRFTGPKSSDSVGASTDSFDLFGYYFDRSPNKTLQELYCPPGGLHRTKAPKGVKRPPGGLHRTKAAKGVKRPPRGLHRTKAPMGVNYPYGDLNGKEC